MTPRTIVVTGASRGIGRHLVHHLAAAGHDVVATCRRPCDAADLRAAGITVIRLDTTSPSSLATLQDALADHTDEVDILVNNAGIKQAAGFAWESSAGPLECLDPAAVMAVLKTNVIGTIAVTRTVLPLLGPGAVVANISSQLGSFERGVDVDYAYNASKAALNMVTVTMQRDLGRLGISAVAINPGWSRTAMGGPEAPLDPDEAMAELAALLPRLDASYGGRFVDRFGEPMPW